MIPKIIKDTNFDIFGVVFFIILMLYFITLPKYTYVTNTLLFCSFLGFLVDSYTVYDYFNPKTTP